MPVAFDVQRTFESFKFQVSCSMFKVQCSKFNGSTFKS